MKIEFSEDERTFQQEVFFEFPYLITLILLHGIFRNLNYAL